MFVSRELQDPTQLAMVSGLVARVHLLARPSLGLAEPGSGLFRWWVARGWVTHSGPLVGFS